MRLIRPILFIVVLLLSVVFFGPFLIPVPPLEGTLAAEQLADPDSQFIEVKGLCVHVKIAGASEPVLVLLHGFGASVFSWREVMAPLAKWSTVIAFDRPGFGLTARPMPGEWAGESPYSPEYQADLTIGVLDALGVERAVLVGHSAGGTVATLTALRHPERVQALILVDAAIYVGDGIPAWLRPLLHTPQARHLGPLLVRSIATRGEAAIRLAWYDQAKVSPDILAGYKKPLQADNWDRALWEVILASHPLHLPERLGELTIPALVITGDQDRIVPTEQSIRLAKELPNARLAVIPDCGHLPQEECPEKLLQAIVNFLIPGGLPQ